MYGTVARLRIKPGAEEELLRLSREDVRAIQGIAFTYVFRTDADPTVAYLAVGFESKAAYLANAGSPEQHERYLRLRALMTADPEWHDGEIIFAYPD
ncbi:MAG TPA: antibiotic biosynthesis monooxygenase [Thermomicrobiales bacterium]|nr:antibiotic biosynthesis monooxygenase [Thermomicrobiales bacterium]